MLNEEQSSKKIEQDAQEEKRQKATKLILANVKKKFMPVALSGVLAVGLAVVPFSAFAKGDSEDAVEKAEAVQKSDEQKVSSQTTTPVASSGSVSVQTEEEAIDNAEFLKLIAESEDLVKTIKISVDGTDVDAAEKWVTQDVYDEFDEAVKEAKALDAETQKEVDDALEDLTEAKEAFSKEAKPGLKLSEEKPSTDANKPSVANKDQAKTAATQAKKSTPSAPAKTQANKASDKQKTSAAKESQSAYRSKTPFTSIHYTQNLTTEKFISSIGEEARQIGQEHNLYASVMIAQAILESGSGNSALSKAPNNNLFGIKGVWYDEDEKSHSVNFRTAEDDGTGYHFTIQASFRAYPTTKDSLEDYATLLTDTKEGMGKFYQGAWKTDRNTYEDVCAFLQGRYATSTTYAESLTKLIETYDLTRFDEPLTYQITGTMYDPESEEADEDGNRDLTMTDYANLQAVATSCLGKNYVWGGMDFDLGFDCSGLVKYVYQEALGINLPRTTYTQQHVGKTVNFDELRMGDLLFFEDGGDVHHVAMYLGDGNYIHAPETGDQVKITNMDEYMPSFAKRIVSFENLKTDKEGKLVLDKNGNPIAVDENGKEIVRSVK